MKTVLGISIALFMMAGPATAIGQSDAPPFNHVICVSGPLKLQVEIKNYRQTHGAGSAVIRSESSAWIGGWSWRAAADGTRLSGYHFLEIQANGVKGQSNLLISTIYSPSGHLSGGWIKVNGQTSSLECKAL